MKKFLSPLIFVGILICMLMMSCMKQERRLPASDDYSPEVIKLIKSKQN